MPGIILLFSLLLVMSNVNADSDRHYSSVGFFDMHVCNWPDRPLFFMALFSTENYQKIRSIEVYTPDDQLLSRISMERYRIIKRKNKADKHVFMRQLAIPENQTGGWYKARVTLNDGSVDETQDYVIITPLDQAAQLQPAHNAESKLSNTRLQWGAVEGAMYYQVFVRDLWDEGKMIFSSRLLDTSYVDLPQDLMQADGWYSWKVHARDINEHPLLGDFNHGSLSTEHHFTTLAE